MERLQVFRLIRDNISNNIVLSQLFTLERKKGIGMSFKWPKWRMKLNKTLHLKMFKAKINIMKLLELPKVPNNFSL